MMPRFSPRYDDFRHEPFLPAPDEVLDLPVWRMISLVPKPSAVSSAIRARPTCFSAALRSAKPPQPFAIQRLAVIDLS